MQNSLKVTALVLTFIVVIPSLVFTVFQINSLSESEKTIQGSYLNRLEAILYSINQHSNNMIDEWETMLNIALIKNDDPDSIMYTAEQHRQLYVSVGYIFYSKADGTKLRVTTAEGKQVETDTKNYLDILKEKSQNIDRLKKYQSEGYIKTEPLGKTPDNKYSVIVYLTNSDKEDFELCGMLINTELFIERNLGPKIDEAAATDFLITITNKDHSKILYSSDDVETVNLEGQKNLWLFPDYLMGIQLKGDSLEQMAKTRSYTAIFMMSGLSVIIVFAAFFVFGQIKKQIEFAQIKSDFVSNVSHELRTPLALISMFGETLELGRVRTEEKKQEYYSIISQEAGRLSRIVNKILNFSKMEAGKRKYQPVTANLNVIVEDIIKTYNFHLKNKGFDFEVYLGAGMIDIQLDTEAVGEAVVNLIDNAMKYSREEKFVEVSTGIEKDFVYLEVTDKGIGISDEDRDRIFEKFFRVSTGLVHNTKGTGLGLSLVKHIMDAHEGKIELTSRLGDGSSFKLLFPINNNGEKNG